MVISELRRMFYPN